MYVRSGIKEKYLESAGYFKIDHGWVKYLEDQRIGERFHIIDGKIHVDGVRRDNHFHYVKNNKVAHRALMNEQEFLREVRNEQIKLETKSTKKKNQLAENLKEIQKLNLNPNVKLSALRRAIMWITTSFTL